MLPLGYVKLDHDPYKFQWPKNSNGAHLYPAQLFGVKFWIQPVYEIVWFKRNGPYIEIRNILIIQVAPAHLLRWPNFTTSRTPAYVSHQMASASLGNLIFRSPAAVPARKAIPNCAILRSASLILPRPSLFFCRETFSRPPKATPSQKYVYPDPSADFASAVSQ